jgi:amidase
MGIDTWSDATAQAAAVRGGEVSATELVEAAIERVERLNPALNAVVHTRFDRALAEAAGPPPAGPFTGVPLVVKDLVLTQAGEPYFAGSRFLQKAGYRAPEDSELMRRFKAAGFVCIGSTNTPEFGSTITTEPVAYGPARNPWKPTHSTGGSSGGSAAAVAAGMVAVGHANDGGGSIRIPASACGLVGLKPSRGRVSQAPFGESWGGATIEGAVTRTVRDAAAVLDAISGPAIGDPYWAPPPSRPFAAEVGADPGRLRIGFTTGGTLGTAHVDPECVTAVLRALTALGGLGHTVEEAHPAAFVDQGLSHHFVQLVAVGTARDVDRITTLLGHGPDDGDLESDNALFTHIGRAITGPQYLESLEYVHAYTRRLNRWFAPLEQGGEGFDLLVTPVIAAPPPPIGWLRDPDHGLERVTQLMQFTAQCNVSGLPAISLPLHWSADGLPVGVQLVAGPVREDLLVRVAAQLEAAMPWADRHPAAG